MSSKQIQSLFILLFYIFITLPTRPLNAENERIEILFLGSKGHHVPSERYAQIIQALGPKGINFTYTEEMNDLNLDYLSKFDALMIYANIKNLPLEQESALLSYVKNGHGLLPIHCASACFSNSQKYINLIGGKFKKHGKGIFKVPVHQTDHPIMKDFLEFETWDETYLHSNHNDKNRTVLQYRTEGQHQEPWTWVRHHGKGRVFYTAYGHDQRTWGHPQFQDLLFRAIKWAIGDQTLELFHKNKAKPLVHSKKATVQNYEKRQIPLLYQAPLTAAESKKQTQWPVEFDLQLFASEPDIVKPIYIAFDERGRCWVAETTDYPNQVNPHHKGHDRIRILEDTNNDGKADSFKTFIEGINIPTSFTFHNDGIIVASAPNFYFFKDTDGDDKADVKKVISTGWGVRDTHAGPSNLKYGFDNYFYGAVGYSGFNSEVNGQKIKFRNGIYRFKPDFSEIEFLSQFNNNTWGLGFSENFDLFGSTANGNPSIYVGIPNRYYQGIQGLNAPPGHKMVTHNKAYPITHEIRQVDKFGDFTAAAGHNLYTARQFPKKYWNQMAFVSAPTLNLLANLKIESSGAGFKETNNWNLTASADAWASPIHAEVGPDGAVWVLDWYNFIIQHNPKPSVARGGFDAVMGKGNAHENPLRDKVHGRIWRVVHKKSKKSEKLSLSKNSPKSLIKGLKSDNLFWRKTAQRLIVERGKTDLLPDLLKLIEDLSQDEIGINGGAIHAIYALQGLNAINTTTINVILKALNHPSIGVRKAALQVLPKNHSTLNAFINSGILTDKNLNVRKDALLAASLFPQNESINQHIYQAATSPQNNKDRWLIDATTIAAVRQGETFLKYYAAHSKNINHPSLIDTKAAQLIIKNIGSNESSALAGTLPIDEQSKLFHLIAEFESSLKNKSTPKSMMEHGRQVFKTFCFSCHGLEGEGTVGPNLTDNHFLHGAKKGDIENVIKKGVIDKGMLSWEATLTKEQIVAVSSYVFSLKGKMHKNGKPPEGIKAL